MSDSYLAYIRPLILGLLFSLFTLGRIGAERLYNAKNIEKTGSNSRSKIKEDYKDIGEASVQKIISQGERLLGYRYRARGVAPWPLDCSGYVSYLFSKIGLTLPRSSASMATVVKKVSDPKPGDLVFFKGRNASSSRVGHVALVVENNSGDLTIMHSTNSRGIIKHRLASSTYFSKRYLYAGRVDGLRSVQNEENKLSRVPRVDESGNRNLWTKVLDDRIRDLLKSNVMEKSIIR